jgi:hypothetical protein
MHFTSRAFPEYWVYEIGVGKQPTVGADYADEQTHPASRTVRHWPINRPVGNPPYTPIIVLKLMIGLRLLDDKDYLSDEMSIADVR